MHHDIQLFAEYAVTPFVGVWIETGRLMSNDMQRYVTPFVGVWIETLNPIGFKRQKRVTPFVGVWIETILLYSMMFIQWRHTLRGCVD